MFRLTTLSAALLVMLPAAAAAGQRVKVDARVQVDRVGAQVRIDIPQSISRDIRDALRELTRGLGEMVSDVTRDVTRDIRREVDVNVDVDREIGRDISRDIEREMGRYRYPDYQDRSGNWRASVDDRQTRTIAIGPNGTLELENFSGDITVTVGSGKDVSIDFVRTSHGRTEADAKAGLERVRPQVDVVGTRATVRADYTERTSAYSVSTDFIVKAPVGTRIVINSLHADVHVTGIKGELKVTTASGDVVLTDVGAIQEAKTASGDVVIKGSTSDGELEAGTLNGDVTLTDIKARRITASSLNGSVVAREVVCDSASLSTLVGDVSYAGSLSRGGRYEFTSNSGDVRFAPTGSTGYALQATSFSGDIASSIDLVRPDTGRSLTGQRGPRRRAATAKVGDGSATVTLQTFSGDISIGRNAIK